MLSLPCCTAWGLLSLLLSTTALAQSHDGHAGKPPAPAIPPASGERIEVPLDASAWKDLAPHSVVYSAHGKTLRCDGVGLADVLRKANLLPAQLRGPDLAKVVLVVARDGYRVSFALAEIDPGTGNTPAVLATHCDGRPLDDKEGPLRLVVPDDVRPARSIRQIEHLYVLNP